MALVLLFLTPGPVLVALFARGLRGGFSATWPLTLGVAIGDLAWSVTAVLTLNQLVGIHGDILLWLKYVAVLVFFFMGMGLIFAKTETITAPSQLMRPGRLAGLFAGLLVIIGNPKAIFFYIGILPGFFDVGTLQILDIVIIGALSASVPLAGNLGLALALDRVSHLLASPHLRRRVNCITGIVLILVGAGIFLG